MVFILEKSVYLRVCAWLSHAYLPSLHGHQTKPTCVVPRELEVCVSLSGSCLVSCFCLSTERTDHDQINPPDRMSGAGHNLLYVSTIFPNAHRPLFPVFGNSDNSNKRF